MCLSAKHTNILSSNSSSEEGAQTLESVVTTVNVPQRLKLELFLTLSPCRQKGKCRPWIVTWYVLISVYPWAGRFFFWQLKFECYLLEISQDSGKQLIIIFRWFPVWSSLTHCFSIFGGAVFIYVFVNETMLVQLLRCLLGNNSSWVLAGTCQFSWANVLGRTLV